METFLLLYLTSDGVSTDYMFCQTKSKAFSKAKKLEKDGCTIIGIMEMIIAHEFSRKDWDK